MVVDRPHGPGGAMASVVDGAEVSVVPAGGGDFTDIPNNDRRETERR